MIITNKLGLPEPIVEAVKISHHKRGDYSCTDLQKDPKILWLARRHDDEITVDVAARLWALMGASIHEVLNRGEVKGETLQEEYLKVKVDGLSVTGSFDRYKNRTITDYKFTSVWAVVFKSSYPDWEAQLNIYAWLISQYGFEVNHIEVIALLRDWQKSKKNDADYPKCQVERVPFKLWTEEKQIEYIKSRVALLEKYKDTFDDDIPECSPEVKWHKPDKWAVMKEGNKSACRGGVRDSEKAAQIVMKEFAETKKGKFYIEHRPGEDTRCADYCDAHEFCNYYKSKK